MNHMHESHNVIVIEIFDFENVNAVNRILLSFLNTEPFKIPRDFLKSKEIVNYVGKIKKKLTMASHLQLGLGIRSRINILK